MKIHKYVYIDKESCAHLIERSCNINSLVFETETLHTFKLVFKTIKAKEDFLEEKFILIGKL